MNQFIGPECIFWGSYMPAANVLTFVSHIHCTIKAINTFKCYTYSFLTIFPYIESKKEFNIRKVSRGSFFWHPITSMLSLKIKIFKLFLWTSGMYFQMHTHRNTTNRRMFSGRESCVFKTWNSDLCPNSVKSRMFIFQAFSFGILLRDYLSLISISVYRKKMEEVKFAFLL